MGRSAGAFQDEDLVDALAVEIDDFEEVAGLFGGFALGRHPAKAAHEPAGQGLEIAADVGAEGDPGQGGLDAIEIDEAIGQPGPVFAGQHGWACPFALAGELAHDGFHDVLEGDDPDGDAEFVDDEGDVLAGAFEEFDELEDGLGFVDGEGLDHEVAEAHGNTGGEVGVDGLDRDDACGAIAVAGGDGEIGVIADHDLVPDLIVGVGLIEPDDLGTRGHDLADGQAIEFEGLVYDLAFDAVEGAGAKSFLHEAADFLLGDRGLGFGFETGCGEEALGGAGEEGDQGRRDRGEETHGSSDDAGHPFRVAEGDLFGDEFAEDEREVGDGTDNEGEGYLVGVGGEGFVAGDEDREFGSQGGPAEGAGDNADEGDADLDGGEETIGGFGELQCGACPEVTGFRALTQPILAG